MSSTINMLCSQYRTKPIDTQQCIIIITYFTANWSYKQVIYFLYIEKSDSTCTSNSPGVFTFKMLKKHASKSRFFFVIQLVLSLSASVQNGFTVLRKPMMEKGSFFYFETATGFLKHEVPELRAECGFGKDLAQKDVMLIETNQNHTFLRVINTHFTLSLPPHSVSYLILNRPADNCCRSRYN